MEILTTDEQLFELQQRLNWFIDGLDRHCVGWWAFKFYTADYIVKNYNVEWDYFTIKKI
jgi:hypothetical protein